MGEKFKYQLAKKSDRDVIIKFLMDNFYYDEPCTQALKIEKNEIEELFVKTVDRCLGYSFSTIVLTDQQEIAGVLLNSVWRRDDSSEDADFKTGEVGENMLAFFKIVNECHHDFWNLVPNDTVAVLHREISSVGKKYQRRGIATRLVTENLDNKQLLREFQIGGIMSETTSFANQCLLSKSGFTCLKEINHSRVVNSKGKCVLKTSDGTTNLKLNFKRIEDFEILRD